MFIKKILYNREFQATVQLVFVQNWENQKMEIIMFSFRTCGAVWDASTSPPTMLIY